MVSAPPYPSPSGQSEELVGDFKVDHDRSVGLAGVGRKRMKLAAGLDEDFEHNNDEDDR